MAALSQLIPSRLYSPDELSPALLSAASAFGAQTQREAAVPPVFRMAGSTLAQKFRMGSQPDNVPFIPAPAEKKKIKLYSRDFYAACTLGGVLSCGLTHTAVTPLDVVKCNMQIDPLKYKSIASGFAITAREGGLGGLVKGWVPTLIGYSIQGAGKFGLYEYFKKTYADMAGPENAAKYQTLLFLAGSASAEFFADIGLCPWEAVKVKVQTVPGFAKGLSDGMPKFIQQEGVAGLWKGITPLWGRQIPYTMMKFACFENTVQALYKYVVPKPKAECSKNEQLGVSFAAGYIAGVFCAVVSHPADNLVSKLNSNKSATIGSIVNEMGWVALATRGLPLRIVMIGTLTGLQWGIYDAFKVYVGLPTTGSAPPPEDN
ncbi:Mitochondrial phosphate carrier protein 3, mitochondrial [Coccomyxa viridis]|uniref:Mitochondrial phosphate carrier protein 3, mitochondrial n=1 Tax=Coccomyxa viridis TaxID=1274662 RepID=A0AAV1I8X3_9CHLO|nr:Mitochondrial phosphate carrier protein 3, mitochondrial [Coccomyxa viridis]